MKLDAFTQAYIECALWSTTDNACSEGCRPALNGKPEEHAQDCGRETGGEPLDKNYGLEDIAPKSLAAMQDDCIQFRCFRGNARLLRESSLSDEQAGHDFWLTRNGHGAGFWDRGLGDIGEMLSAAAKSFGSADLYVGDDGKVYQS